MDQQSQLLLNYVFEIEFYIIYKVVRTRMKQQTRFLHPIK
jgi:hypothetical protein